MMITRGQLRKIIKEEALRLKEAAEQPPVDYTRARSKFLRVVERMQRGYDYNDQTVDDVLNALEEAGVNVQPLIDMINVLVTNVDAAGAGDVFDRAWSEAGWMR